MARRKKRKTGRFLLVAGIIGGGAWWLWKSGKWEQFYNSIMPAGTTVPTDPNSPTDPDLPVEPDGALAAAGIADLLAWLQSRRNPDEPDAPIDPDEPAVPSPDVPAVPYTPTPPEEEPWTLNLPDWLAGVPAGGAALSLAETLGLGAKVALLLFIGTSPWVADLIHDVNLAIPGENTGSEKGNITVIDERGLPVIVTPDGTCFDLAGRSRECPLNVTGIGQPTLDYIGVTV